MLSIILYGRNDNHGYNYHKRLAISLNCLAHLLTDPNDEIIFVDYNTQNDLPTAVEAIQDTLTDHAKSRLKVFRVRPEAGHPFLEPIARNVAIRRSNPANKWILSTNVDMIFVPKHEESLTDIVQRLEDGFYLLPRFELPENVWERCLKRSDPAWNLQFLREQAPALHLNTVVRKKGFILFDNPGDFQLMLRKEIFEMGGFDEEMRMGWHVDSNLCKRMFLNGRSAQSLEAVLSGYHCNHTHTASLMHSYNRKENDWGRFVDGKKMTPHANPKGWGLHDQMIEEVKPDHHLQGMVEGLKHAKPQTYEIYNDPANYNQLTYETPRIFAFIADHLCNIPKTSRISYVGSNPKLVEMLKTYLQENEFVQQELSLDLNSALFIFDFGFDGKGERTDLKPVMQQFLELMKQRASLHPDAKFIGVNLHQTDFMLLFLRHLSLRMTSRVTGSVYGYLRKPKKKMIFTMGYLVLRYLFKPSEKISRFVRGKIA